MHRSDQQRIASDAQLNHRLIELLTVYSGLCDRLINMSNDYPEKVFHKKFTQEVAAFNERGELITELQKYLDENNDYSITRLLDSHPTMDGRDRGIVILTAMGMRASSIAVCLGLRSDSVVRSLRHRLATRLKLDKPLADYLTEKITNRPYL